jgi:hypothetical protein
MATTRIVNAAITAAVVRNSVRDSAASGLWG